VPILRRNIEIFGLPVKPLHLGSGCIIFEPRFRTVCRRSPESCCSLREVLAQQVEESRDAKARVAHLDDMADRPPLDRVRQERVEILPRGAGFRSTGAFAYKQEYSRRELLP